MQRMIWVAILPGAQALNICIALVERRRLLEAGGSMSGGAASDDALELQVLFSETFRNWKILTFKENRLILELKKEDFKILKENRLIIKL